MAVGDTPPLDSNASNQGAIEKFVRRVSKYLGNKEVTAGGKEDKSTKNIKDHALDETEKSKQSLTKMATRKVTKGLNAIRPDFLHKSSLSKNDIKDILETGVAEEGLEVPEEDRQEATSEKEPSSKSLRKITTSTFNKAIGRKSIQEDENIGMSLTDLEAKDQPSTTTPPKSLPERPDQRPHSTSKSLPKPPQRTSVSSQQPHTEEALTQPPVEQNPLVKHTFVKAMPQTATVQSSSTEKTKAAIHEALTELWNQPVIMPTLSDEQKRANTLRSISRDLTDTLVSNVTTWSHKDDEIKEELKILNFEVFQGEGFDNGGNDFASMFDGRNPAQSELSNRFIQRLDKALTEGNLHEKAAAKSLLEMMSPSTLTKLNNLPRKPVVEESIQLPPTQIKEKEVAKTQETQEQPQSSAQVTDAAELVISYITEDRDRIVASADELEKLISNLNIEGYTDEDFVGLHSLKKEDHNADGFKKLESFLNHLSTILNESSLASEEYEAAINVIALIEGPENKDTLLDKIWNLPKQ